MTARWTRRSVTVAAITMSAVSRAATAARRVVSLDWGMTMSMLDLGLAPIGIAEQRLYADWVGTPPIPPGVAEVGLRDAPSLETLVALDPDLILVNPLDTPLLPRLQRIAPTLMNTTFSADKQPLLHARAVMRDLGARIGRAAEAEALIAAADATIATARRRMAGRTTRPVIPLNAVDAHHMTVYGPGSLDHDVLTALGLCTGAVGPTSLWGHRTIAVADLASLMPAILLIVAPLAPGLRAGFEAPGLWRSLIAAGGGQQVFLPPCWVYGNVVSAGRFATLVADAVTGLQA